MYPTLPLILIFLLGASFGSFLSVVIYRIQKNKKGIIFGNSVCTSCKKPLRSLDLIPIVSYIVLRGKCRHCGKAISIYYLFLEIATGLVFLSLYLHFPFLEIGSQLVPFIFYAIYSLFFIGIFFYDLQTKKMPDLFLFPLLIIAFIGSLLMGLELWSMMAAALIALIFFGGQLVISKGAWLGEGDLYFAFSLAVIFGWELFLVCVVMSYITGALVSMPLLLSGRVKRNSAVPFGPFLVIGAFITIFFGNDLLSWYTSTITL